jgi:hypothetical protein
MRIEGLMKKGGKKPPVVRSRAESKATIGNAGRTPTKRRTNLTLDSDAVAAGERYGKRHGTNLSQLVNGFLRALLARTGNQDETELAAGLTPPVRRLYGVAANGTADQEAHRAHLREKYASRR